MATDSLLAINDIVIPLEPIQYHSKTYCRNNGLTYKTENDHVVEYINKLNLNEYIGFHTPGEVVVLADSGYDAIKIEKAIERKRKLADYNGFGGERLSITCNI